MIWTGILSGLRAHFPPFPHLITDFVVCTTFDVFSGARGNRKAPAFPEDSPERPYYQAPFVFRRRERSGRRRQCKQVENIWPYWFSSEQVHVVAAETARSAVASGEGASWLVTRLLRFDRFTLSTRRLLAVFSASLTRKSHKKKVKAVDCPIALNL